MYRFAVALVICLVVGGSIVHFKMRGSTEYRLVQEDGTIEGALIVMDAPESWRSGSPVSIWRDTVKKSPNKPRPRLNLAKAYMDAGLHQEALDVYFGALRDFKDDKGVEDNVLTNIAIITMHYGMVEQAQDALERVLSNRDDVTPEGMSALAWIYVQKGRPQDALALLRTVVAMQGGRSTSASVNYNAGLAFTALHDCVNAGRAFSNAKKLDASVQVPVCS